MLTGTSFETLVRVGWQNLKNQETAINAMNVFPVSDGDTGTNMRLTVENGLNRARSNENLGQYAAELSLGMLLGARGNSGVILSQLFKGIAQAFEGHESADAALLAQALRQGAEKAAAAVVNPTEGTILTVSREGARAAQAAVREGLPAEELWAIYRDACAQTLSRTPEMLPVLKEAGVVDSGGQGLVTLFSKGSVEGLLSVRSAVNYPQKEEPYGFCTEFLLRLPERDLSFDIDSFIDYLKTLGRSIVAIREGDLVKVHVHTKKPLEVFRKAEKYGTFVHAKIENMDEAAASPAEPAREHKAIAFVAAAQGDGFLETFESLGCDLVINAGQTMNTSAEEFLQAYRSLNADAIIVLPNDPDLLPTARQAAELFEKKTVRILPTRSLVEGYFALSMIVPQETDPAIQLAAMRRGMESVATLRLCRAVRQAEIGGVACREGDCVALLDRRLIAAGEDRGEVLCRALSQIPEKDREMAVLFYGQSLSADDCYALEDTLREAFPLTDTGVIYGGQDVDELIVGVTHS